MSFPGVGLMIYVGLLCYYKAETIDIADGKHAQCADRSFTTAAVYFVFFLISLGSLLLIERKRKRAESFDRGGHFSEL
jgi:hypothetical protein